MPYIYDVFISYKRGKINEEWLDNIFLPIFSEYLNDLIPHDLKVFVDRKGLNPGVFFNDELFTNLIQSRCVVSIWSPPYFRKSDWCIMEFLTMRHRQETLRLGPSTIPKTLIWPVLYRDVSPLPDFVTGLGYADFREFNVVGEAFKRTELYIRLQQLMQEKIKGVAEIINNTPPLNPQLETEEGRKKLKEDLEEYFRNNNIDNDTKQAPITWEARS